MRVFYGWDMDKLKAIFTWLSAFALTVLTLGGYAYRQKQKAERVERENERLMVEKQGDIEHIQRMNDAVAENIKRQVQVEQDLRDGKRDNFEKSW